MISGNLFNSLKKRAKTQFSIFIRKQKNISRERKALQLPQSTPKETGITSKNVNFFGKNSFDIHLFTQFDYSVFQHHSIWSHPISVITQFINTSQTFIVFLMSESSQNSSFCAECCRERSISGKKQLNHLLSADMYNLKGRDLKEAQNNFHRLQKEIINLKQQNQKKIQTIEHLKRQVIPKKRKSSVEMQIQENRKTFELLKSSLLTFGNQGFQSSNENKTQNKTDNKTSQNGNVSTQIIINSLQKRLKQYKIELLKVIYKVELHQKSTQWMYQFIESFLKMVVQINRSGRYGEPLEMKELSIKKRTKIAWKYLKDILERILNE